MAAEKPKRRKRSDMTRQEALEAFAEFATRINRMCETSSGGVFEKFAPNGQIMVQFLVDGKFGDNDRVFEAAMVLGGWKLPAP